MKDEITDTTDRKMNIKSLNNLKPFEKGVSGNPSGRKSNKGLKKALNKIGDMIPPEPKEVNPLDDVDMNVMPYTPYWDKRTKKEKVLEKIWDLALSGDLKVIEFLARLGCLD
tara:strand:- start:1492 stop:1827 length:336 start_codon:yes stop_codon:yes gene_type:complete